MRKEADKLEDHLKNIQNTGQLIGEILKQLDYEKCKFLINFIFKSLKKYFCRNLINFVY